MTTAAPGRQLPSDRSRWIALYVLCIGMLIIVLDVTGVNVALPPIGRFAGRPLMLLGDLACSCGLGR
jgi:hypothetical protein